MVLLNGTDAVPGGHELHWDGVEVIHSGQEIVSNLAVAGSLRQGSYNRGLLRAAEELAPDWVEVRYFDIGQLPFFNEDVEAAGDPEPVRRFKDALAASNAVLIATPEYNGAVPGVLANAIDWASRPGGRSVLRNKPVAVMGAVLGQSGSANAQATLRGVLGRIGATRLQTVRRAGRCARRGHTRGDPPTGGCGGALVQTCPARSACQYTVDDWSIASAARHREKSPTPRHVVQARPAR